MKDSTKILLFLALLLFSLSIEGCSNPTEPRPIQPTYNYDTTTVVQ